METRWFLCRAKAGLLLHRQLGASRSSLTSPAGPLASNTPLMADKLGWVWSCRTTNGHILHPKPRSKHSACFVGPSPLKTRASYFHEMFRGNGFVVYGKAIKCQILDWSKQQLVHRKKREKEDLREVMNDRDRWKETGSCDVMAFLQELS